MLPRQVLTVREIGDTDGPYWTAASVDGEHLLLEPGETLLYTGRCQVSELRPRQWQLESAIVAVTDRRTAFLTTGFDKGGGWAGFGVVGLAIATTANVVSKQRAERRSRGKVAIGQARHEWITGLALRKKKALIGVTDSYLDLYVGSASGGHTIELWGRGVANEAMARWLSGVVAQNRLSIPHPRSEADGATLQRYLRGDHDPAPTGKPNDLGWYYPGDVAALIALQDAPPQPASG